MPLRYHQAAADLLGQPLMPSPAAVAMLAEREAACGITLPAALREWYGLEGAVELPERHSNTDHVVALTRLGEAEYLDQRSPRETGRLVIMHENQYVCSWAISLDGSDDPPVLVGMDDDSAAGDESPVAWRVFAPSFSTFVYTWIWDWPTGDICSVWGIDDPLSAEDLAYLRATFPQGPSTHHWPADITYRFGTPDARIIIWDGQARQADWTLIGTSADALAGLLRQVWRCGNLPSTLDERGDACGSGVLERLSHELLAGK